jgi:DNA polymerase-1
MKASSKKQAKRLVLLDSHAILHRAFHAIPGFATSKGEPTGALYGLVTTLLKAVSDFSPDYIIAARDLPGPTFRDQLFEAYKGTRAEIDPALVAQLKKAPDLLRAFGIPVYSAEGFEADDVIGTIAEKAKKKGVDVVIATGDADMFQLVDGEKVQVYHLRQGINDLVLYDDERVRERYGFGPEHVVDYKGIRGDASDNIPGVPGVGEGSATKLIEALGSLEDIYAAIKKDGVEKIAKEIGVQKRYVQLVADNKDKAMFSRELATISRKAPCDFELPDTEWSIADHVATIDAVCDEYEFRSIKERLHSKLKNLEAADVAAEEVDEDVDSREVKEVGIMLWLVNSDMTSPGLQEILDYAGTKKFSDARAFIEKKLRETGRLQEVYERIEKPLIPVVEKMNATGVCLDKGELQKLQKEYAKGLGEIAGRIFKHVGHEFNINSPKQLGVVIYDELKLTPAKQKKTATGQRTTKEEELAKIADQHPIIEDILQFRELQKLLSTYVEKMIELIQPDGRLRAEFLQNSTVTGRMGCQNPNLQNIPIRTEYGRRIRSAFNAPKGKCILSIDYSQIELRVAAGLSKDEKLTSVFKKGEDIHTAVAANVFGVLPEKVDREMRRRAKIINFGILYGMGVNALRTNLGATVTREEAAHYLEQYFAQFPELTEWIEGIKRSAEKNGYVETVFGRRRYLLGFKSTLPMMRAQAERFAVNAPIQGTQADIIKLAMVKADEMIKEKKWEEKVKLILQVHDELVYEVDEKVAEEAAKEIKNVMESVAPETELSGVPIVAEAKVGENWGEMRTLGAS